MIYYLIFILLVSFSIMEIITKRTSKWLVQYQIFCLLIILFVGLRYDVGFDFNSYRLIFENIDFSYFDKLIVYISYNQFSVVEIGYGLLNLLIKTLKLPYCVLIFLISIITLFPKFKLIKYYSPYYFLSLVVLVPTLVSSDMGQIRQGIALSIVISSFFQIVKRRKSRYIILILLASSFHVSSLLFLPIYWIVRCNINRIFLIIFICIAGIINYSGIMRYAIEQLAVMLPSFISFKLIAYLEMETYYLGFTITLIYRLFILYCFYYFYKNDFNDKKQSFIKYLFIIYYTGIILFLFLGALPQLGGRGSLYFKIFDVVIIPLIIVRIKTFFLKTILIMFFVLYSLHGVISILSQYHDVYLPYNAYGMNLYK